LLTTKIRLYSNQSQKNYFPLCNGMPLLVIDSKGGFGIFGNVQNPHFVSEDEFKMIINACSPYLSLIIRYNEMF